MIYIALALLFFCLMLLYFKVANHFNIIDRPNERSSHDVITIRGGGIIYLFAALIALIHHQNLWLPVLGVFTIGCISFIDDRIALSRRLRLSFHLAAVTLLFVGLDIFNLYQWWVFPILYIIVIGIINAYNFMDGINGITGLYSLVLLFALQYINLTKVHFVADDMIWLPIVASVVFLYFNFRVKALCFAGDVGSVTIAFWIIWLLGSLMIKTNNYIYILFLSVYGVDSVLTIFHRLILKQNIFVAHRLHFYQILANECKMPHLLVAALYALIQALIIIMVLFLKLNWIWISVLATVPLVVIYIGLKKKLMNLPNRLELNS